MQTAATTTLEATPKKPWYLRWWVLLIAVLLVIGGVNAIINPADRIVIPDVAGTPAPEAEAALESLGFRVTFEAENGPVLAIADYDAVRTDPGAGSEAEEGSRVTVYVVEATQRIATEAKEAEQLGAEEDEQTESTDPATDGSQEAEESPSSPATENDVLEAIAGYLDERASSGVVIAQMVTSVSVEARVVTVVFDPSHAGIDEATFRDINPFDNLAEFAGSELGWATAEAERLRAAVDRVDTVHVDGTSLGSLTVEELHAIATG